MSNNNEELKEKLRESFVFLKNRMTEEETYELYHSKQYDLSEDNLFEDQIEKLDSIFDIVDTSDATIVESYIDSIKTSLEAIICTKELEIELFNVNEHIQNYFDRLISATKRVIKYYEDKFAVAA